MKKIMRKKSIEEAKRIINKENRGAKETERDTKEGKIRREAR